MQARCLPQWPGSFSESEICEGGGLSAIVPDGLLACNLVSGAKPALLAGCGMDGPTGVSGGVLYPHLCLGYQTLDVWLVDYPETTSKMLLSAKTIRPVGPLASNPGRR